MLPAFILNLWLIITPCFLAIMILVVFIGARAIFKRNTKNAETLRKELKIDSERPEDEDAEDFKVDDRMRATLERVRRMEQSTKVLKIQFLSNVTTHWLLLAILAVLCIIAAVLCLFAFIFAINR